MDIYERYGVKRIINAVGPITRFGGSIILPEVLAAMQEASTSCVDIDELEEKTGPYCPRDGRGRWSRHFRRGSSAARQHRGVSD